MENSKFVFFEDYLLEQFLQYQRAADVTPVTFSQFKKEQGTSQQVHKWFMSMWGLSLTNNQLQSVTKTYLKFTNKTFSDIPLLFFLLKSRYNMSFPETITVKMKSRF